MDRLLGIISWTGWTKEDWKEFLFKFTPAHWISKTGWTREQWHAEVSLVVRTLIAATLVLAPLYLLTLFKSLIW